MISVRQGGDGIRLVRHEESLLVPINVLSARIESHDLVVRVRDLVTGAEFECRGGLNDVWDCVRGRVPPIDPRAKRGFIMLIRELLKGDS
jgi:hypothetical protein